MNAAIRAVVRTGLELDCEVIGIRRGYSGLLQRDFQPLDRGSVSNIIQTGGSMLISSRCPEFRTTEGRAEAARSITEAGIDGIVAIGGDGTMSGAHKLMEEWGVPIIGLPGTIDNDIPGTSATIGFDTAVNTALEAIDRIRDTASVMERIFLVEVMGRYCGQIALMAGIPGGAEGVVIPERETDLERIAARIEEGFAMGRRTNIIVVAEGDDKGGAEILARRLADEYGIESRTCILGHIQRGGSPTARDRYLATILGAAAARLLVAGESGFLLGWRQEEIVRVPFPEIIACRKRDHELEAPFPGVLIL
jgi:6-phosphofructokinase 1